jgi:hypothetical protein
MNKTREGATNKVDVGFLSLRQTNKRWRAKSL